uniref:Platelet-derived growth factor (PDGF) family profile domain-containing protein n=1 Tax=Esox lucius TaxID=8010 RepID=A0AAY5KUK2_ESOLU
MNFVDSFVTLFLLTLLYLSAVKSAHIPKEGGSAHEGVISFMEVYNKSICRPRELLVDIIKEYPAEVEHLYIPSCVVLMRCAGCCNDESQECMPTSTHNITMEIKRYNPKKIQSNIFMSFTEHSACDCSLKKEAKEQRQKKLRKGKGKGQKRKRKKTVRDRIMKRMSALPSLPTCT